MENNSLREQMSDLYDELMETLTKCMSSVGLDISAVADLDDNTIIMVRDYFKILNKCKDLSLEMCDKLDKIDAIDSKLDSAIALLGSFK